MTASIITGVVPILITPFDSQGRIDSDSLQSLIDFNINSGVHGIGVANGSEIFKLNESERKLVTKIVIEHVAGRVPVIINTGAHGTNLAIQYSKLAQEQGADGLMIIPPHFMPVGPKQVAEYYQKNHSAVESLRGGIYEDKIISLIKKKAKSTKKTISINEAEKIILDQNKEPKKSSAARPKIQKTTTKKPGKRKKVSKK